jgi:hypothetical protein
MRYLGELSSTSYVYKVNRIIVCILTCAPRGVGETWCLGVIRENSSGIRIRPFSTFSKVNHVCIDSKNDGTHKSIRVINEPKKNFYWHRCRFHNLFSQQRLGQFGAKKTHERAQYIYRGTCFFSCFRCTAQTADLSSWRLLPRRCPSGGDAQARSARIAGGAPRGSSAGSPRSGPSGRDHRFPKPSNHRGHQERQFL